MDGQNKSGFEEVFTHVGDVQDSTKWKRKTALPDSGSIRVSKTEYEQITVKRDYC